MATNGNTAISNEVTLYAESCIEAEDTTTKAIAEMSSGKYKYATVTRAVRRLKEFGSIEDAGKEPDSSVIWSHTGKAWVPFKIVDTDKLVISDIKSHLSPKVNTMKALVAATGRNNDQINKGLKLMFDDGTLGRERPGHSFEYFFLKKPKNAETPRSLLNRYL